MPCLDDPLPVGLVPAWAAYFDEFKNLDSGFDFYIEIFKNNGLFPLQRQRETAGMMRLARTVKPKVVMEIGADKGGSFYHWMKCQTTVKRGICLEIRGTPYYSEFKKAFPRDEMLFLPTASLDLMALREIDDFLGDDLIDCLFIDGDKCGFEKDFWAYYPKMNRGGIVFLHDIHGSAPPVEVFKTLQKQFRTTTIIDPTEGIEAANREARGEEPDCAYEGWLRAWKNDSCGVGCVFID